MKPLIAGNWKMNTGQLIPPSIIPHCDIVVCPPFTALSEVQKSLQKTTIMLGAQNINPHDSGAYTGEISPLMLKNCGVRYVIIGHSERRALFNESGHFLQTKMEAAIQHGLSPIFCVGETLEQRQNNHTLQVIQTQISESLAAIPVEKLLSVDFTMAYEPIWAIGTGQVATTEQAQAVHADIRTILKTQFSAELAQKCRLLYGGSVKPSNSQDLLSMPDINGALVGGASLIADDFLAIINSAL